MKSNVSNKNGDRCLRVHMYSAHYISVIFTKFKFPWQILVEIIEVKFYGNVRWKLGYFHVDRQTHRCDRANIYILQLFYDHIT
jgi:hypothetical protein